MLRKLAATAAAGVVAGGLMLAGTAQAEGDQEMVKGAAFGGTLKGAAQERMDDTPLTIRTAVHEDCGATITFVNENDFAYWGDYRVNGEEGPEEGTADSEIGPAVPSINDPGYPDELQDAHNHEVTPDQQLTDGPFADRPFGVQYNPVLLMPGETVTVDVEVDEAADINARVWRGPNQSNYVSWTHALDVQPCESDTPPTTAPPATDPPATAEPTDDPTNGQGGGGGDDLPKTSGLTALPLFLIGGGLLLTAGVAALVLARRRRVTLGA